MTSPEIRRTQPDDAADIAAICSHDLGYSCAETEVRGRLASLDEGREAVFVAEYEGKVAGFIHAEVYQTLYFEPMANILGLAVAEAYRRKGYGRALLDAAENWAKEKGIHYVRLNSGAVRIEAHRFYRVAGYDSEKEQIRFLKKL